MQDNEIIHIIEEYLKAKTEHESKRLYNLNIIDELHANENAHTRILLKLLSYENSGKKTVLENFINIINKHINNPENKINFSEKTKIFGQFYFIDGYIKSSDSWAIIIENKINWAADQSCQIDRYIQTAKNEGIAENKIYVIYLTDDGTKKVSDDSFTKEGNILGYINDDEPGRFVALNYQDDILLLLEKTLSQLSDDKEIILVSAIRQYIDYLEGRFGIRKNEKEYNKAMNESLLKILNLTGSTDTEKYEQIDSFQQELWQLIQRLDTLKHEIYPNQPSYIAQQLCFILNEKRDATAPFKEFKLDGECCVFSSNENTIPLSNGNIGRIVIYIWIISETEASFQINIMQDGKGWLDDNAVFKEAIMKNNKSLYKDLTDNFDRQNNSFYKQTGNYNNINDLEKLIMNWIEECKNFF